MKQARLRVEELEKERDALQTQCDHAVEEMNRTRLRVEEVEKERDTLQTQCNPGCGRNEQRCAGTPVRAEKRERSCERRETHFNAREMRVERPMRS